MKAFKGLLWKLAISGIVIYLLTIRFCDVSAGVALGEYPLEAGWQNTGLVMKEVSLEGWAKVSSTYESRQQLLARLNGVRNDLGLRLSGKPMTGGDLGFRYVNAEGSLSDGSQVIITLQSMSQNGLDETHLGFTLHHQGHARLGEIVPRYEQALRRSGIRTPLTVSITGETDGNLDSEQVANIFGRFFKGLEATRVDGGLEGDYRMWRGRTKMLPGSVEWAGERINLESTAAYDNERNVTVVTLATPGISEG